MPVAFLSHAYASHRVACLRLYRALLKQSSLLQSHIHGERNDALSNIVQYRFRKDRTLVSPTQVGNGLNAGYALLDLVQTCNNRDGEALKKLAQIIESTSGQAEATAAWRSTLAHLKRPPNRRMMAKVTHVKAVANQANQTRYPGSKPILERPLPLSEIRGGNRRVPNLVTAQGIPFLRYSKPQPVSLSRYIRQRILWYDKTWKKRAVLEEETQMARCEDKWDQILREEHGVGDGDTTHNPVHFSEPSWADELQSTDRAIASAIFASDAKNAALGAEMWEIVKKEHALKAQEKIERRIARKAMRAANQEADAATKPESDHVDGRPL